MTSFLITCSYATCAIPEPQRELFRGSEDKVTSTDGWEPGSLNLAQGLAMKLSTPLVHGEVSRLLIDLEKDGSDRWSKITKTLPEPTRVKLIDRHERKFRHAIEVRVTEDLKRNDSITHILVHSAPIADGRILLEYGPSKGAEKFAKAIVSKLPSNEIEPIAKAAGSNSALVNWVSNLVPPGKYHFIRLTVSQSFFLKSVPLRWETMKKSLIQSVSSAAAALDK